MADLHCGCCKQPRNTIKRVTSDLIKGTQIYLCNLCRRSGHEPRYVIILAARSGIDVRDYVVDYKYHGKKLFAEEITT